MKSTPKDTATAHSPDSEAYVEKSPSGKYKFKKGNPGRQRDSKNRFTKDVKKAIFDVFIELQYGDKTKLEYMAKRHTKWFYEMFFKTCVPKNIDITGLMGMINLSNPEIDDRIESLERLLGMPARPPIPQAWDLKQLSEGGNGDSGKQE